MPPTSAFTPASSAESVKRFLPCSTTIGFSSGTASLRRSFSRASPASMPPMLTPETRIPLATRSSFEES